MAWLVAALLQAEGGLVLEATDGERTVRLVAPVPAFALAAEESVHPQLLPRFTARWSGLVRILRRGRYAFAAEATVRVAGAEVQGKEVDLEPGDHPIAVEFVRAEARPARLRLDWSSDHFREEPVPSSVLFHRERTEALEASLRAERGRDLFERHGCGACHAGPRGRPAPHLDAVGSRSNARWIAAWLEDPRVARSDAAMPAVPLEPAERSDVAAYLAGLRDPAARPAGAPTDRFRLERGKELFGKIGCAQCHTQKENALAGLGSKYEAGALARFLLDPLKVDPSGRMPDLLLQPDEAAVIAEALVESRNPAVERDVGDGVPARGKALVASRGCLGCHRLDGVPNEFRAIPLGPAPAARGCLAPRPDGKAARYAFSADERAAIEEFLRRPPDRSRAPAYEQDRAIRAFRCAACHALDDRSPAGLKEAGPPPLTAAGSKMRTAWLEEVLLRKKRVRPWMDLRMPHFGEENVAPLSRGFASVSGMEPEAAETAPAAERMREGVRLLGAGDGGLSCISCHDWKDRVALATRGPDLTEMHARMRPDWFRRWLRDPGRIQPGTAMPSFFASVPEAETERRMEALWAALAAGKEMPAPAGFSDPKSFLVAVGDEPVVVRTFMPDASPRAIAVGLPGGTSFCFDADGCRLRYAWKGEFLDMSPAWGGRGGKPAQILGKRFHAAPEGFPLRFGDPSKEPATVFKGYVLSDGAPEFVYLADGVEVRERISAAPDGVGLVRSYRLGRIEGDVWFRAGPGASSPAGEFRDGRLRIPGGPAVEFSVTVR